MDYRKFTKKDLADILDIIHSSTVCRDESGMVQILERLKHLISGDFSVCGMAKGDVSGVTETPRIININYPVEWLKIYEGRKFYLKDPIIWHNFQHQGSQVWEETYKKYGSLVSRDFVSLSRDFGLLNGVSGGLCDNSGIATIFTFAGKWNAGKREKEIMSILCPHLHQALRRVGSVAGRTAEGLTDREKEVIKWMKEGKTNWEISMILNISERTVKFHIHNIERKLDAVNKAHAIAIALDQNLLT